MQKTHLYYWRETQGCPPFCLIRWRLGHAWCRWPGERFSVVSRVEAGDGTERFLVVDRVDVIEDRGVIDRAVALAASTQLGTLGDGVLHQRNP